MLSGQVPHGMRRIAPSILLGLELLSNLKPLLDLLYLLPAFLVVHFEPSRVAVLLGLSLGNFCTSSSLGGLLRDLGDEGGGSFLWRLLGVGIGSSLAGGTILIMDGNTGLVVDELGRRRLLCAHCIAEV